MEYGRKVNVALSNWDTYALLIECEGDGPPTITPCNGIMESVDGNSTLSIHKNYLHLEIRDANGNVCDGIGIEHGEVGTDNFSIHSFLDRHRTMYVLASSCDYKNEKYRYMVGIGCYGYCDNIIARIFRWISDTALMAPRVWKFNWWITDTFNGIYNRFDSEYVGTTRKMIRKLEKYVLNEEKSYLHNWWKDIDFYSGLRYNQGDAYFARVLDEDIPATEVGDQDVPIIEKGLKESDTDE